MKIKNYRWILAVTPALTCGAADVTIPGTADIYGAGHADEGGTGGSPPVEYDFVSGTGLILTVTNVAGTVTLDKVSQPFNGADGGSSYSMTAITSYDGISGISHDSRTMFLVGVFLDASEPADPAPAILSYTVNTTTNLTYSPLLRQTFFIGDGLTGTGAGEIQQFVVPSKATRFFLGFADGFSGGTISGPPSYYNDNDGSLTASVQVISMPSCPTLSITSISNAVVLSWPATGTNATLQSAVSLSPYDWSPVTNTPVMVGSNWVVTNAIAFRQMFYKLACQ